MPETPGAAPRSSIQAIASTNRQDNQRAASVRVALAVFAAVALPFFFPGAMHYLWVIFAYLGGALAFQFAISRNFGGVGRVILGGWMDVGFLTFCVHRMGSESTPLIGAYLLVGMFNSLVAPAWAARTVAGLGVAGYAAVAYAEAFRIIPYAPDYPEFAMFAPSIIGATRWTVVLGALVAVSTRVSDIIARALREREQQLRDANALLEQLSQRDPLTQLYNRRQFVARVSEELLRVRRGHPMALLMMDLDGFKHINDQQGHLMGDELLRKIARTIEESTRAVDVVGRFGGDEFVAILADADGEQALIVAERLVETVRAVGTEADPKRPVTASVGIALARPEDDVTVLLNTADEGAYRAKAAGGDRFLLMTEPASVSRKLESGPRAAQAG